MKKMLEKERTEVIHQWSPRSRRQDAVEIAKAQNKAHLAEHPLPSVEYTRPMSAILREYREYKKAEEDRKIALALQREQDRPRDEAVIVRQLSPQPRPESPLAQRRTDFMQRLKTPSRKNRPPSETKPPVADPSTQTVPERAEQAERVAGKLRRTDSEKSAAFPSVSRTSSYRELPEEELAAFQKNALLTAAERIEMEKERRQSASIKLTDDKTSVETRGKGRRKLPPTPKEKPVDGEDNNDVAVTDIVAKPGSKTLLYVPDNDSEMINRVKLANTNDDLMVKRNLTPYSKTDHDGSLLTTTVPFGQKSTTGSSLFPPDSVHRMKIASAYHHGEDYWPRLEKKMAFNYDKFTRVSVSDASKRRLELRARQRKKIKQKNAQMDRERQGNSLVPEVKPTDRPTTRVSFDENVVVYERL